ESTEGGHVEAEHVCFRGPNRIHVELANQFHIFFHQFLSLTPEPRGPSLVGASPQRVVTLSRMEERVQPVSSASAWASTSWRSRTCRMYSRPASQRFGSPSYGCLRT